MWLSVELVKRDGGKRPGRLPPERVDSVRSGAARLGDGEGGRPASARAEPSRAERRPLPLSRRRSMLSARELHCAAAAAEGGDVR